MAKERNKSATASSRRDGRKAMLVYLRPDIIEAVKDAALANDQKAWQFVERALERALKPRRTTARFR